MFLPAILLPIAALATTTTTTDTLHSTRISTVRNMESAWWSHPNGFGPPDFSQWGTPPFTNPGQGGGPPFLHPGQSGWPPLSSAGDSTTTSTIHTTSTTYTTSTTTATPLSESNSSSVSEPRSSVSSNTATGADSMSTLEASATVTVLSTKYISPLPMANRQHPPPSSSSSTSSPPTAQSGDLATYGESGTPWSYYFTVTSTTSCSAAEAQNGFWGASLVTSGKGSVHSPTVKATSQTISKKDPSSGLQTCTGKSCAHERPVGPATFVTVDTTVTVDSTTTAACNPANTGCTTVLTTSSSTTTSTSTMPDSGLTTMTMEILTTMQMFSYTGSDATGSPGTSQPASFLPASGSGSHPVASSPTMTGMSMGPQPTPIAPATSRPLPSNGAQLNGSVMEQCFTPPGSAGDDSADVGCGSLFQNVMACYDSAGPWTDPYNKKQNQIFQSCFCDTSASQPFSTQGMLWQNFTQCTHCLVTFGSGLDMSLLVSEGERIEDFCASQNPNTYLALSGFEQWLGKLLQDAQVTELPLSGDIVEISTLGPKFSTIPPLANLAYGPSAPLEGSLAGVTPEMTLVTATTVITRPSSTVTQKRVVTELLSWVPTATSQGDVYAAESAGMSASMAAMAAMSSALSSLQAQGGPTRRCIGPCPTGDAGKNDLAITTIAMAMVMALVAAVVII